MRHIHVKLLSDDIVFDKQRAKDPELKIKFPISLGDPIKTDRSTQSFDPEALEGRLSTGRIH
jgi:hypothetical protein